TIWTHRSQILPLIRVIYSTLLRVRTIQRYQTVYRFAIYLQSVYSDYTRCGIEEDESIILRNCHNFFMLRGYITRTALYQINVDTDKFREITFKGFIKNSNSLITPFEKHAIVLIVGRYVYEEDVTVIQSVPVSYSNNEYTLTPDDLLNSSPLLLYFAFVVPNSYIPDNNGNRESFMLARQLYNGITNNKHVDSKIIVSYINKNNRYSALKNNLRKTVLSVIEQLKLGSKRLPYILASDIE
ncbi:4901_t:CDS:2, partial [Racocetra persica]